MDGCILKNIKISFLGAYGTNTGDNAILIGMLQSIDKTLIQDGFKGNFYVFTNYPNYLQTYFKKQIKQLCSSVEFVHITNPLKMIHILKKTEILIVGGGGLIPTDWHLIYSNLYFIPILIAYLFRKFVVVYSIGVAIPHSLLGRYLIKLFISKADIITVRNKDSKRALQILGVEKDIGVYPDPAILLDTPSSKTCHSYDFLKEKKKDSNMIIGLSHRYIFKYGANNEELNLVLLKNLSLICDKLVERYNAYIVFIPFNKHPKKLFENDVLIAKELERLIQRKERLLTIENVDDLNQCLSIFNCMDIIIGMRLHSLILGIITKKPVLGIVSDPKIPKFLKTVNLDKYYIYPHEKNFVEKFLSMIEAVKSNRQDIQKKMDINLSRAREEAERLPYMILNRYLHKK